MFKIEVKDNRLYTLQRAYLTSGSIEIQKAEFIFSPGWDGFAKEVIFKIEGGRAYSVVPDGLNQCTIPWELLKTSDTELYVGVYGTKGTQVMTTNYISLGKIHEGTDDSAEEPDPPPTPDIYRQLITMTETALKEVEELKDEAASGEFDGPPGPEGPPGAPGVNGKDGSDGRDGKDGEDGTNGVSPIVTVDDIEGGHRVTITDADGVKSFDVMDGETGYDTSVMDGTFLFQSIVGIPKEGTTLTVPKEKFTGRLPILGDIFYGLLVDLGQTPDVVYACQLTAIEEYHQEQLTCKVVKVYNYPSSGDGIPVGTIVMWSGTVYNVPTKWHICDGTSGTPDLRGRFVLGVSDNYTKGSKGGEETVKLKVNNLPSHDHQIPLNGGSGGGSMHYVCVNIGVGDTTNLDTSLPVRSTGDNVAHNNMPPYYALFYIMKVEP